EPPRLPGETPLRVLRDGERTTAPTPPRTMRAVVQPTYGTADVLRVAEVAVPPVATNEVLVRVHAAGMDRSARHQVAGRPYLMRIMGFGLRAPRNPVAGLDVI